ncbi:MAG: hypothetical protein ABEJ57_08750 [Halobacteriaceae archaeon]
MSDDEPPGEGGVPPGLQHVDPGRISLVEDAIESHWEDVMADLYATAEEYEEMGWDTVTVRPGDVTLTTVDDLGDHTPVFLVTCPQSAWEGIDDLFENEVAFDRAEVFRAAVDEAVFVVVVLEAEAEETAVLYPLYYSLLEWGPAYGQGEDAKVYTRLRHIDGRFHQVEHEDPELFAPPEDLAPDVEDADQPEDGEEPEVPEEPPGRPEVPHESLADLSPEELADLSMEELQAYQPSAFKDLSPEQRAALNVPRGNPDDE